MELTSSTTVIDDGAASARAADRGRVREDLRVRVLRGHGFVGGLFLVICLSAGRLVPPSSSIPARRRGLRSQRRSPPSGALVAVVLADLARRAHDQIGTRISHRRDRGPAATSPSRARSPHAPGEKCTQARRPQRERSDGVRAPWLTSITWVSSAAEAVAVFPFAAVAVGAGWLRPGGGPGWRKVRDCVRAATGTSRAERSTPRSGRPAVRHVWVSAALGQRN